MENGWQAFVDDRMTVFLALFAEGFFRVIGMIPPFMGIDVDMMQDIIDRVKEEVLNVLP